MQVLFDIKNWNRRKTYEYFKTFDSPTFNICLNLDITELYNKCITGKYKFNHILQYCALKALNEIQEFRLRISDDNVSPWFAFTSVSHAQKGKENNSIPKIVFGQFSKLSDQWLIPLSIDANHALMDAWHVNQFIIKFQESVLSF